MVGTLLQVLNTAITLASTIYFRYISKDWVWFQVIGWGLNVLTVIVVFFFPESPKFLQTKSRFEDLRKVMSTISRVNGKGNEFNGRFDRETLEDY